MSLTVFSPGISRVGTKRKMSPERHAMPGLVNGELDPKLVGPGVPSMDSEGPAPKRRSSAFDTRLAQLQLNDPRSSFDARAGSQAGGASLLSIFCTIFLGLVVMLYPL